MTNDSPRIGRRTLFSIVAIVVLVGGYFGVMAAIRAHVDGVIQHAVDKPMPEFALTDRNGKQWTRESLGGRRAVLHFFRSRCHSCDVEAPEIRALEAALPGDVVLLHVMTDRVMGFDAELTAATLAKKAFTAPVLMADEAFMDAFHSVTWSQVTPITYVVDPKGVVRFGLRGLQTKTAIEEALAAST